MSGTRGGNPMPVTKITSADLQENGGEYRLLSGKAVTVSVTNDRTPRGGKSVIVYPMSQAEAEERGFVGGMKIPVIEVSSMAYDPGVVEVKSAIPVYDPDGVL